MKRLVAAIILVLQAVPLAGCSKSDDAPGPDKKVVVYCSVDEAFARKILADFKPKGGFVVETVFDSEAGKTTGLIQRIIAEAETGRPRGSVLFSSEVFNTIVLARRGLLEPYEPTTATDIPPRFRDAEYCWTGLAVRGRVLAFDSTAFAPEKLPERWEQLAEPEFASHLAFANPLFGTTRGHVATMFALWGPERSRAFLTGLRENGAAMVDGNSTAVRSIISGRVSLTMTDTDDVWVAQRAGASLDLRYLDMGDGGTLLIPCSVAIIKGGPNTGLARELVDYLVSPEVERALALSDSRNIPIRSALREELGMTWPPASSVSYDAVADAMDEAVTAVHEILIR